MAGKTARRRGRTVLFGAAGVLAVLLIGLAEWDDLTTRAPPADPSRPHDARILRDTYGVPHIYGATDADVAYGLAYAHAEDDFPDIEEVLAATRGRLGAITGRRGATFDYVAALLDARATAEAAYPTLPEDTRALIEGYAAGLNRYVETHPDEPRLRHLFPVNGRDIVAGFVLRTPFFFGLDRVLTALTEDRLPPRNATPQTGAGSNAFAVAPARSGDGVTRLLANSHQPWTGGVAWYEAVVHSGQGWDFAGALFPGAPYPLLGHNRRLGWTNTVNRPDLIDVYRLALNDAGDAQRIDGAWHPLERRRVWLRVRLGPFVLPVPRTVIRAAQGPVVVNRLGAFAIRYAGIGEARQVDQYYRLNKAQNFAEWRAAMATQGVPATNFIYADADGHIGFFYNARFPRRVPGPDWRGVVDGDTAATLWRDYLPFSADPRVIDPASGWVANSNNTPFLATGPADQLDPARFAPELGIESFMTNRAHRFAELLDAPGPIGRDRLLATKFDKGYSRAGWVGPWIASVLASDGGDAEAKALLAGWDWALDGANPADALAALVLAPASPRAYDGERMPDPAPVLAGAVAFLREHWHRLDPPLAEMQRIRRSATDLGVLGGPDALRAIYGTREADGRTAGFDGDSFVMLVEWDAAGRVHSESVNPYGASARPSSPHYADQSALFAAERFKPVLFEEADLRAHLEREYRP